MPTRPDDSRPEPTHTRPAVEPVLSAPSQPPDYRQAEDLVAVNRARLASSLIPVSRLSAGAAVSFTRSTIVAPVGVQLLRMGAFSDHVNLDVVSGYTPPTSIPSRNLALTSAILGSFVKIGADGKSAIASGYSDEDVAFLAQQAALAMEGAPLQVTVALPPASSPAMNPVKLQQALTDLVAARRTFVAAVTKLRNSESVMSDLIKKHGSLVMVETYEKDATEAFEKARKERDEAERAAKASEQTVVTLMMCDDKTVKCP